MLNVVRAWILLSTLLAGAGWILSAFHELNRFGYAVVFALAAAALVFLKKKDGRRAGISRAHSINSEGGSGVRRRCCFLRLP